MLAEARMLRSWILALSLGACLWPAMACAQDFRYGVTGEAVSGDDGPQHLLSKAEVQAAVAMTAEQGPVPQATLERWLAGSATPEALVHAGLLRVTADGYALALNYYSEADERLLRKVAGRWSESLAAAFLAERDDLEELVANYDGAAVSTDELLFVALGCVGLDWDGLDVTAEGGWRRRATVQPNGGAYIPWVRARASGASVRALYWGSHNAETPTLTFTTFGDHEALPRAGLPDVIWSVDAERLDPRQPRALREQLAQEASAGVDGAFAGASAMMLALREGPRTRDALLALGGDAARAERTLKLLEALSYVAEEEGRYRAAIPVFTPRDAAMLDALRIRSREIIRQWLVRNHAALAADLSELSSVKAGVPLDQLFTDVWHDLFGWTNYRLVRAGLLADPYGPSARFVGFTPFVWTPDLKLMD